MRLDIGISCYNNPDGIQAAVEHIIQNSTTGEEFAGSTPEEHLEFFHSYAPELKIDYCLVDSSVVRNSVALDEAAAKMGGRVIAADIRKAPGSVHHDVSKLTLHLGHIMGPKLVG